MSFWEWAFWGSLALVLYPYLVYPALIITASRIKKALFPRCPQDPAEWPEVTIVIPAYREAESVVPKMESIRRLDYPKEKLRVLWVISADENDPTLSKTLEALRAYPEAEYVVLPRQGKNAALNAVRSRVSTPLVLFSDANALLSPQSLREAVKIMEMPPAAEAVGGARLIHKGEMSPSFAYTESPYLQYEGILRAAESEFDMALGLPGEFFLLRTAAWLPIPHEAGDDQYIVLRLGMMGKRLRFAPRALAYETPSADSRIEFHRKARIACNAFHTIRAGFSFKDALRHPTFAFSYISHKLFRYIISPVALIGALVASIGACVSIGGYHCYMFGLQALAWIEAGILIFYPQVSLPGWMTVPGYFILAHMAQLAGLWKFLRREDPLKVWQRLPRTELQPSQP